MTQQVTITVDGPVLIKPLLESAIQAQSRTLMLGMRCTQERLQEFERRYGMTSVDFERQFEQRILGESFDFIEWLGEVKMLCLLEDQQRTLEGLHIQ